MYPIPTTTNSQRAQDSVLDLTSRALRIHADSHRRGSVSPVYTACTRSLIYTLAQEIVALSNLHKRSPAKIISAAEKAIAALRSAMDDTEESIDHEIADPISADASPRRRDRARGEDNECMVCGANPGETCRERGREVDPHVERIHPDQFLPE